MRSALCALLIHCQPKIQPAIAAFSAGEFRRQPALSDNTEVPKADKVIWYTKEITSNISGSILDQVNVFILFI